MGSNKPIKTSAKYGMTKLTSRPVPTSTTPSKTDLMEAAKPSVNILTWVSKMFVYPDDSRKTIDTAHDILEQALDCMLLFDYVVMASPSPSARELHYDVAIKPIENAPYVAFKVMFRVQP